MTLQSPTATLIPQFSSSELTGCGYPGLLDRKNRSDMCLRWESNPRLPACKTSTLSTRPGSPLTLQILCVSPYIVVCLVQVFVTATVFQELTPTRKIFQLYLHLVHAVFLGQVTSRKRFLWYSEHIQSNFNGSNTFGTMKISSRQG